MGVYTALKNTSKSFNGEYRNCSGTRDSGGANLVIKSVPGNLKTLTVTITASPNDNGDGGLYEISLRVGGQSVATLNTSKERSTQFSYTFQKSQLAAGQVYDIRYWNNSGGWDSVDPCDYYRQDSEDSVTLAAYTGNTKLGDGKCTITLSEFAELDDGVTPPPPPASCCPVPPPWPIFNCGSAPRSLSSPGGLILTQNSDNQVKLNLKNYANKLVTLKIIHQTNSPWSNTFSFNIPNCSDISPDTGGNPYSKGAYSGAMAGTNVITLYNIDGGDYDYLFNCDSTDGPKPTRTNCYETFYQSCSTSGDPPVESCVTVCVPNFYTEQYPGQWPPCTKGITIGQTGGTSVRWYYSDGNGDTGSYDAQIVTIEVVSVRNAVPQEGAICTSTLKNSVSLLTNGDPLANCFANYIGPSVPKIRYRSPQSRSSKSTFKSPTCYSEFRGIAGAKDPNITTNVTGNTYSIFHTIGSILEYDNVNNINTYVLKTTQFTTSAGISSNQVETIKNISELYKEDKEFGSANTTSDPYYSISSTLIPNLNATEIIIAQKKTADGITITGDITVTKSVSNNRLNIWFYINEETDITRTDSVSHFPLSQNNPGIIYSSDIIVVPQGTLALNGGSTGTPLNFHYKISFLDKESKLITDSANFNIYVDQSKNEQGSTIPLEVEKKEINENGDLLVWFKSGSNGNTYVRAWRIVRDVQVLYQGNTFIRNWYIKDTTTAP